MSNPFDDVNPFGSSAVNPFASSSPAKTSLSSSSSGYVPPTFPAEVPAASTSSKPKAKPVATATAKAEPSPFSNPKPEPVTQPFIDPKLSDIEAREARLRQQEATLEALQKNFPPCYPIARNHPSVEIPKKYQFTVRFAYLVYLGSNTTLFFNFIVMTTYWGSKCDAGGGNNATSFLVSFLYSAVTLFMGWRWYKQLYHGCATNKTSQFICFFIAFFVHCLFFILGAVGVPQVAMAGFITMVSAFNDCGKALGFMALVSASLFVLTTLFSIMLIKRVHGEYRVAGIPAYDQQGMQDAMVKAAGKAAAENAWEQASRL